MSGISRFTPGMYTAERQAGRLKDMRATLSDLTRQLATGRVSDTLGGLGASRSAVVDLRAQLARAAGHKEVNQRGALRLDLMSNALDNLRTIAGDARRDALSASGPDSARAIASAAEIARGRLMSALGELNADFDGQFLFSGRATDTQPVPAPQSLIDGTPGADGLRTLISERRAADRGDGTGRLALDQTGASVSITEDTPPTFGFRLKSMVNTLNGGTIVGPNGVPQSVSLTLTAALSAGQTVTLALSLPDGSSESVTLVAREAGQPGAADSSFVIAGDLAGTAANLKAALATAIRTKADTALSAASSIVAAQDFFAATEDAPARRIDGPPFDVATGFVPSGARVTQGWYQGDASAALSARQSQVVTIDRGVSIAAGARANEAPMQAVLAGLAALAAEQADAADPQAVARYRALSERAAGVMSQSAPDSLKGVISDVVAASSAMTAANQRHTQRTAVVEAAIADIEQPSLEDLSASILSLQTRMEASYQVTASIGRLSLASYLG